MNKCTLTTTATPLGVSFKGYHCEGIYIEYVSSDISRARVFESITSAKNFIKNYSGKYNFKIEVSKWIKIKTI